MRSIHTAVVLAGLLAPAAAVAQARESVARAQPPAAVVTSEQFRGLKWLAGRWHGVGIGSLASVGSFYEEYAIVDDSTMRMHTHADSTFTRIIDSTRFELRGGRVSAIPMRGTGQYIVRVATDSTFWSGTGTVYARVSNDVWRAIFPVRSADAPPRYYELRRVRR